MQKKLGFLGDTPEAERLAKAFTGAKLFNLKHLSYLAEGDSEAFKKLGIESAHDSDSVSPDPKDLTPRTAIKLDKPTQFASSYTRHNRIESF